jgi:hypothetical protein
MANEISLTASLSAFKAAVMQAALGLSVSNLPFTMTGNFEVQGIVSIGTSATAIPLGQVTTPHWAVFINKDTTNYVTLANGASGAVFARLLAGEPAFVPLDPTMVPYGTANTAPVIIQYLILSL